MFGNFNSEREYFTELEIKTSGYRDRTFLRITI